MVLVLVNDCRSDVSPVNNADSDHTINEFAEYKAFEMLTQILNLKILSA